MAVPGRRNGMIDEDDADEVALFDEDVVFPHPDSDIPPHLQDLAAAAEQGDVNSLRQAIDNLAGSIDEPVEDGDTALHLACLYGHMPCVQLLVERGACLEAKDEDGAIPLHDACAGGFTEIVQLLINSASNQEIIRRMLESVDVEGDTPLHHAARGEHVDIIRLLLSYGASPTKTNSYGKVPSELADQGTEAQTILEPAVPTLAQKSANNPSVGGFITHCGWNSTLDAVCAGVPMVTCPTSVEQYYNEKLMVNVLKIGLRVGVDIIVKNEDGMNKVYVSREQVKEAIEKLMHGEEKWVRITRAKELSEMAIKATEEVIYR